MPILTIEAIRENPWNVVSHTLPAHPTKLLLEEACLAADYCRVSEYALVRAARDGSYVPAGYKPGIDPDVHEESEARGDQADKRMQEICDVCMNLFGLID